MNKQLKQILVDVIPPGITRAYRNRQAPFEFHGNYQSWSEALQASTGYENDRIVSKVRASALQVRNGKAAFERDSVTFETIEYEWHIVASLLWIASRSGNVLDIIDFGGALGSLYFQNLRFLQHISALHWTVVEQQEFVDIGKKEFENTHLQFAGSIGEAMAMHKPSAILLSSVLPYIAQPYDVLESIMSSGIQFIIIDRTPLNPGSTDRLLVQKVSEPIYNASYPAWFLSETKVLDMLLARYDLVTEYDPLDVVNVSVPYRGFLFERNPNKVANP